MKRTLFRGPNNVRIREIPLYFFLKLNKLKHTKIIMSASLTQVLIIDEVSTHYSLQSIATRVN